MNPDLDALLESAAAAVFTTMLDFKVEFESEDKDFVLGAMVAGNVGLTGTFDGMVYLYSSAGFARAMTCRLLGMKDAEIEGNVMVNDVIGELTNMVAGHIKSKLENAGNGCIMTIPSVIRGTDFKVNSISGIVRKCIHFRCNDGRVLLEAFLRPTKLKK
jgi:chemotaxis protein CheX